MCRERKRWQEPFLHRAAGRSHGELGPVSGVGRTLMRTPVVKRPTLPKSGFFETVARAPGCPQKTFIVQFGSEPLSQEGNTMFGPGEYRPDPSAGITAPADLPQPEIVPYSRNDLRQSCPRCGHSAYRDRQSHRTLAYSTDSCHLVHRKVATQSTRTLPPNPQDCCHPVHVNAATWTMKVATHARRSLPPSEQRDAGSLLLV